MEAMILAAGLGTRLRPLTDHIPKALIDVGGLAVLERVARRLIEAGCDHLVVNVHHHADRIRRYIGERNGFGVEVTISEELEQPLETGGGLKQATPLFTSGDSFFMHNADILTDLDLAALMGEHLRTGALATLAVREPETPRYLLFDADDTLVGYGNADTGYEHRIRSTGEPATRYEFCGVQAIHPRIFDLMTETGVFSIIKVYLRLAAEDERIGLCRFDGSYWIDIGHPEQLKRARALFTG